MSILVADSDPDLSEHLLERDFAGVTHLLCGARHNKYDPEDPGGRRADALAQTSIGNAA
jgi:hypothetical protein